MVFQWLKSLGSGRDTPERAAAPAPSMVVAPAGIEPTPAEIAYVERCWADFRAAGLVRASRSPPLSAREWAVRTLEGIGADGGPAPDDANRITANVPYPPLTVLWLEDEDEGEPFFANAVIVADHVHDVASGESYRETIAAMAATARDDWPLDEITVTGPLQFGAPYGVTLRAGSARSEFQLVHGKDLDWSLIERLNENLPASVARRFGWLGDGGGSALVVFLLPAQIRQLGASCGIDFQIPGPQAS